MNGITFFVCSTVWVSLCVLVAISKAFSLTIRLESRAPCQKEVKRRLRMKVLQRRKREHVWWRASKWVRKSLHEVCDLWSIWECRWEKRSRTSTQETGATRLKFRSRIFSSESTTSIQETARDSKKSNRKWWDKIFWLHKLKETCCDITRIEKHSIHEPSIHEQDLSFFAEEVRNVLTWRNILKTSIQNKCIDTEEDVRDFVDESRHPPWAELCIEFGNLQENEIRGDWKFVQHYSKIGNRAFWRDSDCEMAGIFITFLREIDNSQWSSDQMGKGKSMCLCCFRSMCWTGEELSRSDRKVERSSGRTQVVFVSPRCSGVDGEAFEFEWKFFHRIFIIVYSSRNPARLGEKEHAARGVEGPDHLHINVQWHWVEKRMMRIVFRMLK